MAAKDAKMGRQVSLRRQIEMGDNVEIEWRFGFE